MQNSRLNKTEMGQLLTKTGLVKALDGDTALVVTKVEAECESCKAKDACSALGGTGSNIEVRARNTAGAQVGDIVKISIQTSSFLKATFVVYMVPILALIGGMISGYLLAKIFSLSKDVVIGALAGLGLVGSFIWLKKKGDRLSQRPDFVPEVISKTSPPKTIPSPDLGCPVN